MKKLLFILCSFWIINLHAQWIGLPNAISPYSGPNSCFLSLAIPDKIMPVGDGKIMYTTNCQMTPSSGGVVYYQYSSNDLFGMQIKSSVGPMIGCCPHQSFFAYNDSCFSFSLSNSGMPWVMYTSNKLVSQTALFNVGFPGLDKATCITPNLVYCVGQNGPSDSMRVFRSTKTGASLVKKTNYLYNPLSNKLQFVNDSTGFTLVTYRSNTAKTALLKTIDYGATWIPVHVDSVNDIRDYHVMPTGKAYLCKTFGQTYYSNDFGDTWTYKGIPPGASYNAIRFMNDSCGYIGGNGGSLFKTVNRGITWTFETSNTTQNIQSLYTFGNIGYFVDASKKVFKNSVLSAKFFMQTTPLAYSVIACNSTSVVPTFTFGSNVVTSNLYTITAQAPSCLGNFTFATSATNIGFTFPCAGIYTLTGYDGAGNLLGVVNYTVAESTVFNPTIISSSDTICSGTSASLSFTTNTPNYAISPFNWSTAQSITPISVSPTVTTTYSLGGLFTAGTRTCNVISYKNIIVNSCVGINEFTNSTAFKIYPNPATDILYISTLQNTFEAAEIEILNTLGQIVSKNKFANEITIAELKKGYYILRISLPGKGALHYKFVKE